MWICTTAGFLFVWSRHAFLREAPRSFCCEVEICFLFLFCLKNYGVIFLWSRSVFCIKHYGVFMWGWDMLLPEALRSLFVGSRYSFTWSTTEFFVCEVEICFGWSITSFVCEVEICFVWITTSFVCEVEFSLCSRAVLLVAVLRRFSLRIRAMLFIAVLRSFLFVV